MDGVILFVAGQSYGQVEEAMRPYGFRSGNVSDGTRTFFFRRYPEWGSEIEPGEDAELERRLGGAVTAAFVVESRHGGNARFALEALACVMETMHRSAVEDHLGGLWCPEQIAVHALVADHDVFSLPQRANPAVQRKATPPTDL
ncbi:hypothetical protein G7047_13685 [Diaphorobacter sp. HDW4A]|uniref:hypothetical protein n=1 Tax=Diaphorobacter sp. HDW4A TaxID=2714924 RepID=UPI00140D4FED|nr:hypothetical protein [Diaphorobacter sp. HDW4A]QIL80838.1 hypothetical protein G7047_13685 [Diaphorobacter sp. HDW4A]